MSEDDSASLKARSFLEFLGEDCADSAKSYMPEFVLLTFFGDNLVVNATGQTRSFSHYHYTEVATTRVTLSDGLSYFIHVEGTLGNQNHIGAAGDAAIDG